MNKKVLYIMCGAAGSGKTTWVRESATPGVSAHISRDRIRFEMVPEDEYYFSKEDEVYAEFVRQIAQALNSPWVEEVYADATHLNKKAREKLVKELAAYNVKYILAAIVIRPSLEETLKRNANRTGRENVPESVIKNMYNSYTNPLNDNLHYSYVLVNDETILGEVGM